MNNYNLFNNRRKTLLDVTQRTRDVCGQLAQKTWADSLEILREKVLSDRFKVMVIGNFKSGKSTFINALLGERVLPAYAVPCTAVINEVKWGAEKQAVLHFRNPLPEKLPSTLSAKTLDYIRRSGGKTAPPMNVPVEDLEEYVVIPDPARPQQESVAETPYDRVELSWPLEICRNGVEIIDSPGLNEHTTREKVTVDYLSRADAVLFVMTSLALAGQSEINFIEFNLRGSGHEDIFFICNRFDQLDSGHEQDRVRRFATERLTPLTNLGGKGIYFISASQAVQGRINKDAEKLETSGIIPLETALSEFLVNQRGRLKLLQPARELTNCLRHVRKEIIPSQRSLLGLELVEVEKKVRELSPKLADARRAKDQMLLSMSNHFGHLHRDVRDAAAKFLSALGADIPGIVNGLTTDNTITLFSFKQKEQAEALTKEILEKVDAAIQGRVAAWREETLDPMFEASLEKMQEQMKTSVDLFYERLGDIQSSIVSDRLKLPTEGDPSGTERFFASVTGLLTGDLASGLHGARFGFKGLMSAVAVQLGVILAIVMLHIVNPIAIFAAIFGAGFIKGAMHIGSMNEKLKKELGSQVQIAFNASIHSTIDGIRERVQDVTNKIAESAGETLERDIKSIQDQADAALRDKQAGEQHVNEKRGLLDTLEKELNAIDDELSTFIWELAAR